MAAVRSGTVTGVAMPNGQSTAASITLDNALAQTTTATFNLRRSQFTANAGTAGPGMTYQNVDINGFSEKTPYDYQPWVFWYTSATNTGADLPLTVTYGNPYPTYTDRFEAAFWFRRDVTAPGATSSSPVYTFMATYRPTSELTGDIAPKLSRATGLKINDMDATVAHTGTTQTPKVSWTAPSTGTATHYTVSVYRIINQGGATVATIDGMFTTTSTSLKIPPGFIKAGETYMIAVRAQSTPGYDPAKPFARLAHYDLADTISETMLP